MIQFTSETNSPHTVEEDFWVELSKIDTNGVEDPILAFMLSPDGTAPRIVNKVVVTTPLEDPTLQKTRIYLYGIEYRWGWEWSETMPWWEMNDTARFTKLEVCGPEYLESYRYKGSTRSVSMPFSVKERIAFNKEVYTHVRDKAKVFTAGIANTLWIMRGNVEMEESAWQIARGGEASKYALIEDNRWLYNQAEELSEGDYYNVLANNPDREWKFDNLIWDAGKMLENDGTLSMYPDDGEDLPDYYIPEKFNIHLKKQAMSTIDKTLDFVREWCINVIQYDPHFNKDEDTFTPLTTPQ